MSWWAKKRPFHHNNIFKGPLSDINMKNLFTMGILRYILLSTALLIISQSASAAELKAKAPTSYKPSGFAQTELDLSGLTDKQNDLVMSILNNYNCTCGCTKGTWANCIKTDVKCPFSRPIGAAVIKMIEMGKNKKQTVNFLKVFKRGKEKKRTGSKKPEDPNKIYPVTTLNAPVKGPEDAPVTLIEYTDYQCPYCRRVQPTLSALLEEFPGKVRFATLNNPLSFHKNALPAAMAARAAGIQEKFWEMHTLLFEDASALDDADLLEYAERLGLDIAKFNTDRNSKELKDEILQEQAQAVKNNATGTPAFFINGKKLSGAKPLNYFKTAIENELKAKKK